MRTTTSIPRLGADLSRATTAYDGRRPASSFGSFDPASSELADLLDTVELRLASCSTARRHLIDSVRAVRLALTPVDVRPRHTYTEVAPLEVPDRITRRDYNYFNELNAALQELAAREQRPIE